MHAITFALSNCTCGSNARNIINAATRDELRIARAQLRMADSTHPALMVVEHELRSRTRKYKNFLHAGTLPIH